jgi:hypothetical protein
MRPGIVTAVCAGLAASAFATGCSSGPNAPTSVPAIHHAAAPAVSSSTVATPTPSAATTNAPASVDLSGSWSGQYSGTPWSGTFTLTWTQTGSSLNGSLKVSDPAGDVYQITGSVAGSSIQFGAVGAVSYTGSVSGNSMSGNWTVPERSGYGGSWSASKSS